MPTYHDSLDQAGVVGNQDLLSIGLGPSILYQDDSSIPADDDLTFENGFSPQPPQRRSNGPWNHLHSGCLDGSATTQVDNGQRSPLQQPNLCDGSPESRLTDEVLQLHGRHYRPKSQSGSGLSLLFAAQQQSPTVNADPDLEGLDAPADGQVWSNSNSRYSLDNPGFSTNFFDRALPYNSVNPPFPSQCPPSIVTTDQSYPEERLWDESDPFSYHVYDTSTDLDGSSQAASHRRRQSFADIDSMYPGCGNLQDIGSPSVNEPDKGPHAQPFDSRFLSPSDLRTLPIAVPSRPLDSTYDSFKPGIAASYPPAALRRPRLGRSTANRAIAPRSRGIVTECPTPQTINWQADNRLSVVREDGKGGALVSPSTPKKGRRIGCLSPAQATQAARNRKAHSVCIKCRMMKQSCSGGTPYLVEAGPCDWRSQRVIEHSTVDSKRTITEPVDQGLSISRMSVLLTKISGVPSVLVRQSSRQLYKLKIHEFSQRFEDKRFLGSTNKTTLMSFLNGPMKAPSAWMECIEGDSTDLTPLIRFNEWNNLSCPVTYAIVTAADSRQLNPEHEEDATTIFVASQLARIVCRAVELLAFSWLQKELNGITQGQKGGTDVSDLVQQLGRTLLNLRRRLSWWEVIETESSEPEEGRCTCTNRVQTLCRILYVYYFIAQRKLPSWTEQDRRSENGLYPEHPDAEPMVWTLPHDESLEGFEHWMQRGCDTVSGAVVE
ncbi:MAG: hypothetical protein Q9184_000555 [Pyrenodesmia sp. 2 TL-2023]